jgi:hypothetical protein
MKPENQTAPPAASADDLINDLINGLKHMANDHPCCEKTIQFTWESLERLQKQRDDLAEALREMRYGHTDKAERMAVAALKYLEQ